MTIIDSHVHLFRPHSQRFPRDVVDGMMPADRDEPVEKFLVAMDDVGVDRAVVVPTAPHDGYLAEVLERHPDRFIGLGLFDSTDSSDPAEQVTRRCELLGLKGMRFYGFDVAPGESLERTPVFEALAAMQQLGLVVSFYASIDQLLVLDQVMHMLPELRVVLNHLGYCPGDDLPVTVDRHARPSFATANPMPSTIETVERMAAEHPSLNVHLSGAYAFSHESFPYLDLQPLARRLLGAFGAERLLLGSDWPWIHESPGYQAVVELPRFLLPELSVPQLGAVVGENAGRVFGM